MSAYSTNAGQRFTIAELARTSRLNGLCARMDFETRSAQSIKLVGAFRYAIDPSTSVLCLSYKFPNGDVGFWHPWQDDEPLDLFAWVEAGGLIESHNAEFEYAIWNYNCVPRLSWPQLKIEQLRCSAAKAAVHSLPRKLEGVGNALELPIKKDMDGHRIMLKLSKPRRITKKSSAMWNEDPEDLEKLFNYCETDVLAEEAISEILAPLRPQEQIIWELTTKINERGIYCDIELCKIALEFSRRFGSELTEELRELTDGKVQTIKQLKKVLTYLDDLGVELPDMTARTISEALAMPEITGKARRVLEIRQALSKSSVAKFKRMIQMAGPDNRIRGTLLYSGATTGRFTGRGIQPQNYAKATIKDVDNIFETLKTNDYEWFKTIFPDVLSALSSALRGMLRAPEGRVLNAADFSGIEARVNLWLSGDEENLNAYVEGIDSYKEMASDIYGVPYEQVTKDQRELGKRAILGCGFGMGWKTFHKTCATQGFPISEELAKLAVAKYRERYWKVKGFWHDMERLAIAATQNPGRIYKYGDKIKWLRKERFLYCKLPSGRNIVYPYPEVSDQTTEWGVRPHLSYKAVHPRLKKWLPEGTYGGKLVENIVQATARDVMVEAMWRVEMAGYENILSVHDEVIAESDLSFGSKENFEELMSRTPKWAKGLPIKVEGWRDIRYKK